MRVSLTPKAVDLLTVLAARAGEVVSKAGGRPEHAAELFRRAIALDPDYPGNRVNLATIAQAILKLDPPSPSAIPIRCRRCSNARRWSTCWPAITTPRSRC